MKGDQWEPKQRLIKRTTIIEEMILQDPDELQSSFTERPGLELFTIIGIYPFQIVTLLNNWQRVQTHAGTKGMKYVPEITQMSYCYCVCVCLDYNY